MTSSCLFLPCNNNMIHPLPLKSSLSLWIQSVATPTQQNTTNRMPCAWFLQYTNLPVAWFSTWNMHPPPGIILCMRPANERRRYSVTSSPIGWAHAQNDLCWTRFRLNTSGFDFCGKWSFCKVFLFLFDVYPRHCVGTTRMTPDFHFLWPQLACPCGNIRSFDFGEEAT